MDLKCGKYPKPVKKQPNMLKEPMMYMHCPPMMKQMMEYDTGMSSYEIYDQDDTEDDMEVKYMKKMYPDCCQKIQYYVEKECDKMDYQGSPMYEMYPDKETIEQIVDRIYGEMKDDMPDIVVQYEGLYRQRYPRRGMLNTLIDVIFLNELYRRRRRRRRRRCGGYPCNAHQDYYPQYNPYYY